MYPLKFKPIYQEKPWGNQQLKTFRDDLPAGKIGETWDLSCRKDAMSIVENGEDKGKTFQEMIDIYGEKLLGTKMVGKDFPLLVKILSVSQKLSVQVHPDDEYAQKQGEQYGKEEIWYIMDAEPGAKLILGTNGCTKEEFEEAIRQGKAEDMMNKIHIQKGEIYHVKSGLIHTVDGEVMVSEIQQNSDTTYRVYDYNRGRELHIDHALNTIRFDLEGKKSHGVTAVFPEYTKTWHALSKNFSLEHYDIVECVNEKSDSERFFIFTCVVGSGEIFYNGGSLPINKGDTVLIPADLGEYTLVGHMEVLKTYVPDFKKVQEEIMYIVEN